MYDSGIKCSDFINSIIGETDISVEVSNASWYRWLSAVEQFVYTEIVNECKSFSVNYGDLTDNKIPLSDISVATQYAAVCYDDVTEVYADDAQLEKSGVKGIKDFADKDLYYTDYNGNIIISTSDVPETITVIYRLKPLIKSESSTANVYLPIEFVDMAAARLRGEAYKIANEDGLAGKWLADYNTQLESFKVWAEKRNMRYGG